MASKSKTTNVYDSTAAGVAGVLDELTRNEPLSTGAATPPPIDGEITRAITLPGGAAGGDPASGPIVLDDACGPMGGSQLSSLPPPPPPIDPREAAVNAVELALGFVGNVCEGEWQPDDERERQELVTAAERVLARRPALLALCARIPPELILLAVLQRYGRKRTKRPATRTWLQRLPLPNWLRAMIGIAPIEPEEERPEDVANRADVRRAPVMTIEDPYGQHG